MQFIWRCGIVFSNTSCVIVSRWSVSMTSPRSTKCRCCWRTKEWWATSVRDWVYPSRWGPGRCSQSGRRWLTGEDVGSYNFNFARGSKKYIALCFWVCKVNKWCTRSVLWTIFLFSQNCPSLGASLHCSGGEIHQISWLLHVRYQGLGALSPHCESQTRSQGIEASHICIFHFRTNAVRFMLNVVSLESS